ncbi:CubicO group peptidase (beta-lactamase class C family) [Chitinophaga niastensis]|uniref:CubicO group peptidase (Beta-lactamase class C family) n=1 Tax=Chitinophaga niastensis TaxID=536980 RepID=A0A2P8HUP8_CHINA|nr:serine hydrolase [Chitinophaga niastensis]PSL49884.1 CubicO group peptidase (beta-lactamase class C family) [Chitinophaga niastensis]
MNKILWLLLLPVTIHAQQKNTALLNTYMQSQSKICQFSGTVLLVEKGKVVYENSFGEADREWHTINTRDSKYRIGSLTKQFTAACILLLEEKGKLSLDDKLNKYIPDYPQGDVVTIHMLLNQTSGIKDYTQLPDNGSHADVVPLAPLQMINEFKNEPYNFPPGTQWAYSNSNYFLLGYIIEMVSGEKYNDYLLNNIISKAKIKNTGVDKIDSILKYRVKGYEDPGNGYINAPYYVMEGPFSAGAMYSTVNDLYQWDVALMNNKILLPRSIKKMTTPYQGRYGYGLWIDSLGNHKRIWHNGGIPGFNSCLAYYPTDDLYVVVISNDEANTTAISNALASILFNFPVINPYKHKEIAINSAILDNYVGKYLATNTLELIKKDNKLYRRGNGSDDMELKPESNTKFFYADGSDRQIEFEVNKTGKILNAFIIVSGLKTDLKKQ